MPVASRAPGAVRPHVEGARQDAVGHRPADLLHLPPHLFLLALDEGHDVRGDVERRDAGISRTGERLVRRHMYVREVERVREGLQRKGQARDRAVRVRHDEAALSKRWLTFDEQEVVRIHFRHQERNVRVHTVSRRVGEDSHARLGGVRFDVPGDFRREGAERRDDVVRPEDARVEWLQFHRPDVRGERNVFEPPEVFEVSADLSLGRREGGDLERGVVLEQAYESLADIPGRPQDCHRNLAQRGTLPAKSVRVWPISRRKSAPSDAVASCHSSSVSRIRRWMNGVWGFNAWMSLNSVGESAKSPAAAIERRENVVPAELSRPARSNGLSATHRANVKRQSWLSPKRNAIDSSW